MRPPAPVALRPPEVVMHLSRMGSFHATRLSFMRQLLRRMRTEGWRIDRPLWEIDGRGVGRAVYRVRGPARTYSLVVFSHDLPDNLRSDRVIAEAWDATFALFDGEPTRADLDRLSANVPFQEAGRVSGRELTLSRANRSVRLFGHVVEALAAGCQPDPAEIAAVGYLMRTTAVYGSGKFGLADRDAYADRVELASPFQAEMLSVYLIREFTFDIVAHLAAAGGSGAVRLAPEVARRLGIGNSTGLGMAPFLVNHPVLLHRWMVARETALARVRALDADSADAACFAGLLGQALEDAAVWRSEHPIQLRRLASLRSDLERIRAEAPPLDGVGAWNRLWQWGERALSEEGQERLLSLMLEPNGTLVDDLAGTMSADEAAVGRIDARWTVAQMSAALRCHYGWALAMDWADPAAQARLWYTSAEKLEPRLAERAEEPLEEWEQPLAPGRDAAALARALEGEPPRTPLAELLARAPEWRWISRRVQIVAAHAYGEIRDNTISGSVMPIDMLRCKLSFFGADQFDPRSDRWVRINMFRGAPLAAELTGPPRREGLSCDG